jgi:hypothetical protein
VSCKDSVDLREVADHQPGLSKADLSLVVVTAVTGFFTFVAAILALRVCWLMETAAAKE